MSLLPINDTFVILNEKQIYRSLEGPLLNGINSCHIIVNEFDENPKVIMLIGEMHGKQSCGESDYVTAYQSFLHYNEVITKVPIDMLIEVPNYTYTIASYDKSKWIGFLRTKF